MKRIFTILLSLLFLLSFSACGGGDENSKADSSSARESSGSIGAQESKSLTSSEKGDENSLEKNESKISENRILVAFFSHTGENYNVGYIEKGNTHIIAEMIAEETGADMFEIRTVNPYPDVYRECTDAAKKEQNENARPEIIDPPENLDGYDTVFVGYPIWWGDLPMAVYTFLERYDFSGKTVIPFCTHEGSGLSGTEGSIGETCPGATVLSGFAIRGTVAQNKQDEARAEVINWLEGLEI